MRYLLLLGSGVLVGCSGGSAAGDAGAPASFVADAADFDCFHKWPSAPAVSANGATDGLHVGPLTVYWNQSPPHGAKEFPVGTIVVKESQEADPTRRTVFAMVKRGGGFNAAGAVNWEWLSLEDSASCDITILWRNVVPPPGEVYSGTPAGDCNGCHESAKANDYVWDKALTLSNF